MTKLIATITLEMETPEIISVMTPAIRAEFTLAIGEAYNTLNAIAIFNNSNGARTIIRSIVNAELAEVK